MHWDRFEVDVQVPGGRAHLSARSLTWERHADLGAVVPWVGSVAGGNGMAGILIACGNTRELAGHLTQRDNKSRKLSKG
jgi:hypothetical protein